MVCGSRTRKALVRSYPVAGHAPTRGSEVVIMRAGQAAASAWSSGTVRQGGGRHGGPGRAAGEQHTSASGQAGQGTEYVVDVVHEDLR
jgi:hypothetical protein